MEEALVLAAADGNVHKVVQLLSLGARVDMRYQGYTPLLAAADRGQTEVCQLLLEAGSDLEETEPFTMSTALNKVASQDNQSLLKLLLSNKANFNSSSINGFTPLHMASQEGHLASVVTLLQAGADQLLPKHDGFLPIHQAAQHNHVEVVRILIEQGGCSPDQVRHTALQSLDHLSGERVNYQRHHQIL